MREVFPGRGKGDTPERRVTDAASQEHRGSRCIAVERQVAGRAFHLNGGATGITFNTRLNAVSRMRVATMRLFSYGALAIVNVRVFPSASVSDGVSRVISTAWPASNVQPDGFSKWKAMAPSAISWRPASFDVVVIR
jgi:hypothetical protein